MDRYSRFGQFIPTHETDDAWTLARQYLDNVVRLHGHPESIVSDRGTTFASAWWREVCALSGTDTRLSTAFHPQTNGGNERVNQTIEHMLRCYVDYGQDDWSDKLAHVQLAYNDSYHSSIKQSPFYLIYGRHARDAIIASAPGSSVPEAVAYVSRHKEARELAECAIKASQLRTQVLSDIRTSTPPDFKAGDRVLVNAQHIATTRPAKKLAERFIGPYTILAVTGTHNFRLDIAGRKLHPVFHVDRLRRYIEPSSFPGRPDLVRPPPVIAESNEYEVARILDDRCKGKKKGRKGERGKIGEVEQYLVEWVGYGEEGREWVDAADFDEDDEVVLEYHAKGK